MLLFSHQVMSDFYNSIDCSTPDFPVLHYLPEFTQTHVHWVSDAIQLSHPLSTPGFKHWLHYLKAVCLSLVTCMTFWAFASSSIKQVIKLSSHWCSVQFSYSVVSDSLWPPQGLKQARPPCPSPTPRVYSNSCPLSPWCHPTISSSVVPFSSSLQFVLDSGSFPISRLFPSGGQSIGASASASVLPMNIQGWYTVVTQ